MFNEGRRAANFPAQVQAQAGAGMWTGNHSYTHPHLTQLSESQVASEISRTQQAIANAGGGTPRLFRPPYGETNSTVRAVEARYGLTEILWDVDSQDWNGASTDAIVRAAGRLTDGQIILMHELVGRLPCRDPADRAGSGQPQPVRRHDLAADRPRRGTRVTAPRRHPMV